MRMVDGSVQAERIQMGLSKALFEVSLCYHANLGQEQILRILTQHGCYLSKLFMNGAPFTPTNTLPQVKFIQPKTREKERKMLPQLYFHHPKPLPLSSLLQPKFNPISNHNQPMHQCPSPPIRLINHTRTLFLILPAITSLQIIHTHKNSLPYASSNNHSLQIYKGIKYQVSALTELEQPLPDYHFHSKLSRVSMLELDLDVTLALAEPGQTLLPDCHSIASSAG